MNEDDSVLFNLVLGTVILFCGLFVIIYVGLFTSFFQFDAIFYFGVLLYSLMIIGGLFMIRYKYKANFAHLNRMVQHEYHTNGKDSEANNFNYYRSSHSEDNRDFSTVNILIHDARSNDNYNSTVYDSVINRPKFKDK